MNFIISPRIRNRNLYTLIQKYHIEKDPQGDGNLLDGTLNLGDKGSGKKILAPTN